MINIANLLRNAKKGTILWSPLFGPVEFMQLGKNDQIWIKVDNSEPFDKYGRYFGPRFTEAECLLFPSKDCRTWEGWTPPVEPNFKVGDWVVRKDGTTFCSGNYAEQITLIEVDGEGKCIWLSSTSWVCDDAIRLWEISDAKEGDVLAVDWNEENGHVQKDGSVKWQKIVIFKSINKVGIEGYGCTFRNNKLAFDTDVPYYSTTWTQTLKPAIKEQRDLLFQKMEEEGYVWDDEKKELCKINKAKFRVGDWLWHKERDRGAFPMLIAGYDEEKGYLVKYLDSESYFGRDATENEYRLWEISDARNGDVLVVNGSSKEYKWIGIFKAHTSDTSFSSHCHYNCGMCEFVSDIARCTKHGIKYNDIRPATNEERDLLFAKMREAGYEWDEKKKELKNIPKHYDISSFYAGMPVLVRDYDNSRWSYVQFSHYVGECRMKFNACGIPYIQCIPFNEETKHLLGTTDMCDEQYINW